MFFSVDDVVVSGAAGSVEIYVNLDLSGSLEPPLDVARVHR